MGGAPPCSGLLPPRPPLPPPQPRRSAPFSCPPPLQLAHSHLDSSLAARLTAPPHPRRWSDPFGAARRYCAGQAILCPSSRAARRGRYGSRSISPASSTMSACPLRIPCSACAASVISPTAPVAIPASRLIASANGTWYPVPSGILAVATFPPDDASIRST